ncbi:MAG: HD domain-containing protein [Clostridia bacterium]|nr:HD domain-containing protein [Clostridia bacterium]
MISIKQIVKGIVITILVVLSFSILFNFFLVTRLVKELNQMNRDIQALNSLYIEMELPLRVFKNISSQTISDDAKDAERKNKILKAYQDNRVKFKNKTKELKDKNSQLNMSLSAYVKNALIQKVIPFGELSKYSSNLNQHLLNLEEMTTRYLKESPANGVNDTNTLERSYEAMRQDFSGLSSSFDEATKLLIDKYILVISILFVGLLMCVMLLAVLLNKVINKGMTYMLQGFRMMNQHDYDPSGLPEMKTAFSEEKQVESLVTSVLEEQKFLSEVKAVTSSGYIIDDILEDLFYSIQATLKTDRVGIAFVDYHHHKIIAEHGISNYGSILLGPGFEIGLESTTLSKLIESKTPMVNNDLETELALRPESASLKLLRSEGIQSNMIFPLVMNQSVFAFLFFSSVHKNNYDEKSLQVGQNIALEIAALLDKTYLTKTIFSKITNAFSDLVDKKDNETGDHITRMVQYSVILAKALLTHTNPAYQVNRRFVRNIENNASVHDIGKVGIPDEILKKPGKLTPEEWEIMKTHSTIGGDIFAGLKESLKIFNRDFYRISEDIARHHHERWDGSGYPAGLAGHSIPLSARIVALADVFDALTSKRVYKGAFGFEESVEIINQSAGSHLDPELVRIFNEKLPEFKKVYEQSH